MAAILCQALWKPCDLCCKGINKCFDACGRACDECCRCCGQACSSSCQRIGDCCQYPVTLLANLCEKPFSGTFLFAFFCNLMPFVLGISFGAKAASDGCSQLGLWLVIQGLVSLLHILFTFYVFARMQRPFDTNRAEDANIRARFHHMMCWDPWFALYIIIAIFDLVWLVLGVVWISNADASCSSSTQAATVAFVAIGWVYLGLGALIFWCSWCCDCVSDQVTSANDNFHRQFGLTRDVERGNGRRSNPQVVVQGQPVAQPTSQQRQAPPVVTATAIPVDNETDTEMAARLQREEDARSNVRHASQSQPPQQKGQHPASDNGNIAAAGRTALWGAKMLGTAVVAAGSAVATAAAEERRRAKEEEAQRRATANAQQQQQQQQQSHHPGNFRSY